MYRPQLRLLMEQLLLHIDLYRKTEFLAAQFPS